MRVSRLFVQDGPWCIYVACMFMIHVLRYLSRALRESSDHVNADRGAVNNAKLVRQAKISLQGHLRTVGLWD